MFSIVPLVMTYLIARLQGWLPFNPQGFGTKVMTPGPGIQHCGQLHHEHELAVLYVPETTVSYFTNMVGLATHNFFSAAAGIAIGDRAGARLRAALRAAHRQLLGGYDARARCTCCCRSPIVAALVLVLAGRDPELRTRTPR